MLELLGLPADAAGCGHLRIMLPVGGLGGSITTDLDLDLDPLDNVVAVATEARTIVFQRPMSRHLVNAIPVMQRQGMRVAIDIDDDFTHLHPKLAVDYPHHPARNPDVNWQHLKEACRLADVVTVSTPQLAERFRRDAIVIRNCIPRHALRFHSEQREVFAVGWAGEARMHPDDLPQMGDALATVKAPILIVGTAAPEDIGTTDYEQTGLMPFERYYAQLSRLTVGVAPLADTAFNRAKSWIKPLEYMALGIPCIASPTPEYLRLGHPIQFAARPRHWRRYLRELVRSESMRLELSQAGRALVEEHHILEDNLWRWQEAWLG